MVQLFLASSYLSASHVLYFFLTFFQAFAFAIFYIILAYSIFSFISLPKEMVALCYFWIAVNYGGQFGGWRNRKVSAN